MVKLLIENGANVNAETLVFETPLGMAESRGHMAVANILKENGAKKSKPPKGVQPFGAVSN